MSRRNRVDWRTIIRRLKRGKVTPIISDRIYFPGRNTVLQDWSREIRYPFPEEHGLSIARLAQFLSATSRDELTAKEDFLDFSKRYLLDSVRDEAENGQLDYLDQLEDELLDLTFSELAVRLNYPQYDDEFENPLLILASLPIPIYITTSYYDFLERELRQAGKEPRTEVCYWYEAMDDVPSVFDDEPDYDPTPEEPLVYHLNGSDQFPSSLVLTEDDYLDFLAKVSRDMEVIPRRVAQALVDSSLLLLGYQLDDWNFKTMFRGLISAKRASRRRLSVSIQYEYMQEHDELVDPRDVEDYLVRYFDKANFEIYWGQSQRFLQELWEQLEGS